VCAGMEPGIRGSTAPGWTRGLLWALLLLGLRPGTTCGLESTLAAGSPPKSITIIADPGPFGSIEAAAQAEQRVEWRDSDHRADAACTRSFAATELRHFLAATWRAPDALIRLTAADTLPTCGDVFLLTSDRGDPRLAGLDTAAAPALPSDNGQGFRIF